MFEIIEGIDAMDIASLIREYLEVLLSWPVVAGIIIFIFVRWFKKEIAELIPRIRKAGKDGVEIYQPPAGELPREVESEASDQTAGKLRSVLGDLAPPAKDEAETYVDDLRKVSEYWQFSYLVYYFVPTTKIALQWIRSNQPCRQAILRSFLTIQGIHVGDESIPSALHHHGLIASDNAGSISITDKGERFLQFAHNIPSSSFFAGMKKE